MNINDLIKLAEVLDGTKATTTTLHSQFVGKYVIVRSRNEGINAGKVVDLDETGIVLEDARRLYYHEPAEKDLSWYEGVAVAGLSQNSKVGAPVTKMLAEDYSITVCSCIAEKSIRKAKTNEQS